MLLIFTLFCLPWISAQDGKIDPILAEAQLLVQDRPLSETINLTLSDRARFRFYVPEDTIYFWLELANSPADLDIFIRQGVQPVDYNNADAYSVLRDYNEALFVSRFRDSTIPAGQYIADVVYQIGSLPLIEGVRRNEIPFSINFRTVSSRVDAPLDPGIPITAELNPETGMFRTYTIDVPQHAKEMRIDIFDAYSDIDIFARHGAQIIHRETADYVRQSLLANERMVLSRGSDPPLQTGRYFITIVDQVTRHSPEEFSIVANFSSEAPAFLQREPEIPAPESPLHRAVLSTVEIISDAGRGSGCILTSRGLMVTNYHVVTRPSGRIDEEVEVGVATDLASPSEELFSATLVDSSEELDLALYRIDRGLYGNALSEAYRFPWMETAVEDGVTLGMPISLLGYPTIGGSGSKVSITYTRGIVSGFERTDFGTIIKTDGEINPGNSGGAALNDQYRLIGLPTSVIGEEAGQLGYIHPVHLFPDEWIRIIEEETR